MLLTLSGLMNSTNVLEHVAMIMKSVFLKKEVHVIISPTSVPVWLIYIYLVTCKCNDLLSDLF